MSIRTATMSNSYLPAPRRPGFGRKLVFTMLFVIGIASFMALFNVYQQNLSLFWMTAFAILSIGLASGSASRMTFYQWSGFLRFFVVLLAVPLGLLTLGLLTSWQMGIGPLDPWVRGVIPQDEMIQLGVTLLVAIISLVAWWKPRSKIEQVPEVQVSSGRRAQMPMTPSIQVVEPASLQVNAQESLTYLPKRSSRLKFLKATKVRGRTVPLAERLTFMQPTIPFRSKRKKLSANKPNLQISHHEEHRCPFCLDEVHQNDPRGVKKCEVCNAFHHADCWAITGMCQVPHLNT